MGWRTRMLECLVSLTRLDFLQIEMKYAMYNDYHIHGVVYT